MKFFSYSNSFIETKSTVTKRKRENHNDVAVKRRVVRNSMTESDDDDDGSNAGVTLSPRIAPIAPKTSSSPGLIRHFLNSSIVARSSSPVGFLFSAISSDSTDII